MTTLQARLDKIQRRLDEATPGPYYTFDLCLGDETYSIIASTHGEHNEGPYIAYMNDFNLQANRQMLASAPGDIAFLKAALVLAMEGLAMAARTTAWTDVCDETLADIEQLALKRPSHE